jgi:phosphate-selective porin OprO/OprP
MVFQQDSAAFFEKRGGYNFSSGTLLRHASLWGEGEYGPLAYQIVLDLPNGGVSVTDAWLRYRFKPTLFVTAGLLKAPFGFQYSNNDNYDIFIERSMFGNAAAAAGSGRRVGLASTFQNDRLTVSGGIFGDNAGLPRSGATVSTAPGDSWGVDGRLAWRPVLTANMTASLGLSGYHREALRVGGIKDAVRFTDRPNIRVDGGNIADSGIVTGVKSLDYLGGEAVGIFGPVMVSGEYGSAWLRRPASEDVRFDGFYAMGSLFLTGEHYSLIRGQLDRLRPLGEVGKGGLGALEVTLRYDHIDLADTPVLFNHGNRASAFTAGINWYLTPYAKLLVNYVRFSGTNSPLDPVGSKAKADAIATRLHVDM